MGDVVMIGDIMTISRLRMASDGTGVSTLIVFYGCPLRCYYCINDLCHEREEYSSLFPADRGAYSPEALLEKVRVDDVYFKMTGGGVVFGGGEPLLQADFIRAFCAL